MKLLDTRRKVLVEFSGDIPPYAILSHTWQEEEVLFQHLQSTDAGNFTYTGLKGWYKIERSCEQALEDGLEYVWIDTTCIDKSSSAELSEAINSMFAWYRDSTIGYAYLCDVPAVDFKSSRWFTRGWTLQEMIAPRELKFYDCNWNYLGSKSELVNTLYQISGVDEAVLLGRSLRFTSIARRMSWAAKRQTKRVEDIAYCLLGLFDISMPMLYGEGPKAFIRLQEEIVKEYDDHSLFAWKGSTSDNRSGLFATSPADFAYSADIVPCVGPRFEPTVVTSRGLRITTDLTMSLDGSMLLAALNCRTLGFDMAPMIRVAIGLKKCSEFVGFDALSAYVRVRPGELFDTISRSTLRESVYVLGGNHLDFSESHVFWLRTLPLWAPDRPYKLHTVHPRQQWDGLNNLFRIDKLEDAITTQFVLVFQQESTGGEPRGYFLVFLGITTAHEARPSVRPNLMNVDIWCHTEFHQGLRVDSLDFDRPVQEALRARGHQIKGGGYLFKSYTSIVALSGQMAYCADLYAKDLEEPGS